MCRDIIRLLTRAGYLALSLGLAWPASLQESPLVPSAPAELIKEVREHVMQYDRQLPNFICVESIRRYSDLTGTSRNFQFLDSMDVRLTYFGGREEYKIVRRNGEPVAEMAIYSVEGTLSRGEFGTLQKDIFRAESHTVFQAPRSMMLNGQRVLEIGYDIKQTDSRFHLSADPAHEVVPAYRGQIVVDAITKTVVRMSMKHMGFLETSLSSPSSGRLTITLSI